MSVKLAKIEFRNGKKPEIEVPVGSNLMQALLDAGLPVASSCRGEGVCAKCRVEIVSGVRNLGPENELEKFLRERHSIEREIRVSCQVTVLGDIVVDTTYW